jgi:TPR repeat protein
MFRSSEAAARARIADLEREIGELKEQASDRQEEHVDRIRKLEEELDRARRGERSHLGCWIAGGVVVLLAGAGLGIALLLRSPSLDEQCKDGEALACVTRGYEVRSSDPTQAERLFLQACDLGSIEGCGEAGWLMMARGDWAAAEPFLLKACEANYALSCVNIGVIVGKRNDPRREEFARKACDLGSALGCSNLAGVMDDKGQLDKAIELATKACNQGTPFGCADLAWYELKDKKPKDALKHATRASQINAEHSKVQVSLGYALAVDGEVEEAIRRFRRGIELENNPSNERTYNDQPWAALVRKNLEYLKTVYPDREKDFAALLSRHKEWNP